MFKRHLEVDRKLPGVIPSIIKRVTEFGIKRRIYVYDFTSRPKFENEMRLSDPKTRVINYVGSGA